MIRKERLDILLAERGLCASREQAQRHVLAGEVWQGSTRLQKPGVKLAWDSEIELRSRMPRFVSRGGEKLEHGLKAFGIGIQDRVCLDVGASTGGFTDCLLQAGAKRVFALDVGHGQLHPKIRSHEKVSVMERVNARHLTQTQLVSEHSDAKDITFVCADASFISLRLLIPAVLHSAPAARDWLLLFKPQFEVGPEHVGKNGLVRDQTAVAQALQDFDTFMQAHHFTRTHAPTDSPVAGKKSGNTEILLHYEKN